MEFGIQFFPDIGPKVKSAAAYFDECLRLVDLCDELDFTTCPTFDRHCPTGRANQSYGSAVRETTNFAPRRTARE